MNIVIASGKGGTGKTTVATNLASYISELYKETEKAVVLTDIDVEEPNSGVFMHGGLFHTEEITREIPHWDQSRCTMCKKCSEVCNFNAIAVMPEQVLVFSELCHACYACSGLCPVGALPMKPVPMGYLTHYKMPLLDFVEGKLNIGEQQATPMIGKTKEYIEKTFAKDAIKIFDAPPGTSCPVIEATNNSSFVILVAEPTPFGVHDFKLSVETMKKLEHPFAAVINKHGIGNNDLEAYCKKENIDIIGKIPNMRAFAEHYSKGKLLYQHFETVAKEMEKIFLAINKKAYTS